MAKTVTTHDGHRLVVRGFRHGGGINLPYVYAVLLDNNDNSIAEMTFGIGTAKELASTVLGEAEFAESVRGDGEEQ